MSQSDVNGLPNDFEWKPDYDDLLDEIASTDQIKPDTWPLLRNIVKFKLQKNIALFSLDGKAPPYQRLSPETLASGGLKLPPFPSRKRDETNPNEAPKSYMTEAEAGELKGFIFEQLDDFDESPPFTIQRVCELCLHPQQQYKSIGKYLRAVEKALLVTSSWDAFPPDPASDTVTPMATISVHTGLVTAPPTPMFSPIPFLHEDARRSKSRSPPPSPLALSGTDPAVPAGALDQKGLGMVDELDDPSPGHMSEHPTALSSVTTTKTSNPKPFLGSLEQRFTSGDGAEGEAMAVDDTENKENKT